MPKRKRTTPERLRQRLKYKKYRHRYRKQNQDYQLRRKYGITYEERKALIAKQDSLCAICLKRKPLHVDHSHTTKLVRGMLCFNCNAGLGSFLDSEEVLARALAYLRGSKCH